MSDKVPIDGNKLQGMCTPEDTAAGNNRLLGQPVIMFTAEKRSKWLAHFLAGNVKLPDTEEMEEDKIKWQKCMAYYAGESGYKRFCVSVLLQIYSNDQLCKDMGCNPWEKKWLLSELFSPYCPSDYANLGYSQREWRVD